MQERQNDLTSLEKEELIRALWNGKKARSEDPATDALYVALDSPRPSLVDISRLMFEELSNPDNFRRAKRWAETWGRVVVCVQPGGKLGCRLGEFEDPKNRIFVPVQTNQKLDPKILVDSPLFRGRATIVLNNQQTTVEALVISFVHMIDELVWGRYRSRLTKTKLGGLPEFYQQTLIECRDDGFSLTIASEDEILVLKRDNPQALVRLYGSGVNKDVPRVMGVVILAAEREF